MKKRQEELAQVLAVVKIWHIKLMTKQSVMKIYYIKFLTKQVILVPQFAGKGCQCSDARIKHHQMVDGPCRDCYHFPTGKGFAQNI